MAYAGDRQIQIIFTKTNQYRAQIFVYRKTVGVYVTCMVITMHEICEGWQEPHMKLCMTGLDFVEKNFLSPKLEKWTKNGPKTDFFEFIEKFGDKF